MDRFSDKRGDSGLVTPRKRYAVGLKDKASEGDQNAKFCNRIGCSGRIKYTQNTKIGSSDKAKSSKPSIRPSNVNEITRKSSTTSAVMTSARKSYLDSKRKLPSQLKSGSPGSSPLNVSEASELMSSPSSLNGYRSESMKKSGNVTVTEAGRSSLSSKVRPRKAFHRESGSGNQNTPPPSCLPSASKSSALGPFNCSIGGRNGLRNTKSNSISDVLPPNCSPLKPDSRGKNMMKKRSSDAESGASRTGRKMAAASPVDRHLLSSSSGISISDSRRNSSSGSREEMTGDASLWTRRSTNVNTRMRPSYERSRRNSSSVREPSINISQIPDSETPFNVGSQNPLCQFSENDSSSSDDTSSASTGLGLATNHEVFHRRNMDNR
ncbi:hypothetical protein Sango_2241300 [Sesamum angolense]|uniref:Uncharacterized protein n=1 Tax=Sesamum angolense TaxID=2727404 RepID=A0AAE2BKS6_9LAMI|nr:hypothetical protein Sango_2241300 [Sesamum angolense]